MSWQSRLLCGVGIFAFVLLNSAGIAHTPEQPPHQTYSEGDLKLESGEVHQGF
jgi:homoserine O-acetyltransferase